MAWVIKLEMQSYSPLVQEGRVSLILTHVCIFQQARAPYNTNNYRSIKRSNLPPKSRPRRQPATNNSPKQNRAQGLGHLRSAEDAAKHVPGVVTELYPYLGLQRLLLASQLAATGGNGRLLALE